MKKNYLIILLIFVMSNVFAQNNQSDNTTGVIIASEFHKTRPLTEIVAEFPVDENKIYEKKESGDRKHRIAQKFPKTVKDGPEYGNDPKMMQNEMGTIPGRAPITNWAGQTASGFRPYDPSGAPGLNHYIQMINSTTFKVYNKTSGTVLLTATLGTLWSPATANAGDPIVMYDKDADRWFLAQFGSSADKKIYIAVSATSDPLGAYYTYTYVSPLFPDYLKFSVWADGYYMTSNQSTQKVFCFNRAEMLAGTPGARSIYINFSPPKSGFFCPLPGDAADGTLPAYGTPCPIFSYSDNGWGGGYSDAVNIYQMAVNWVPTTPTATVTLAANVATSVFDASYDANWDDVSQPGTAQKLDGIGGVCMYRAQWKSWAGYNTILLNWGVKITATHRSIMWAELRQDQTTSAWSLYQEGIYNPDSATRWMGGIAMDVNGSIGLSYMKSDATSIYPSLGYTGRRSCDPLGTLPITETMVIAGTGYQTGTNRVGDYAQTSLDPDGITFWHTSEYMGGTSGGSAARTRIFSYQLPSCTNTAVVNISVTSGSNPQCTGASITFTASPTNGGTTPSYQWKVNGTNVGTNSTTYTSSSLTNGQVVTCVMTSNLPGVLGSPATSNSITMTVSSPVTPSVAIALTTGSNPTCAGSSVTFTATPTNGGTTPAYQWKINGTNAGTNSATFTTTALTNGQIVTCVLTSNALCATPSTATSNSITMTVNPVVNPTVSITQTAGTNPQCTGASATFTATVINGSGTTYSWKVNGTSVGTNSPTYTTTSLTNGQLVSCDIVATPACASSQSVTLGTGTGTNSTTSDLGAAYPTYYGSGRQQYLVRASELTALGLSAGNITSLGFSVAGTTGNPSTLNGYSIKLAETASTVMTAAFLTPTFTTVFGPVNYVPTLSSINTHTFISPFVWNGSSNILIDICFSNQVVGTVAYQTYLTASAFVSTAYYQADGAGGAGACTTATVTNSGSTRPNMIFTKLASTANASSNVIAMNVSSSLPASVLISQTSGTNPQCAGASATFTAVPTNGGTTPSYQWKVNGTNVGTNSTTYTTTSLTNGQIVSCVITSNAACVTGSPATSNSITMVVNASVAASVSISQTAGTNPQCAGALVTFTVSPVNGGASPVYQWKVNGTNVGINGATHTTSSLSNGQVVTCEMTSNAPCVTGNPATSNSIIMGVNNAPVINSFAPGGGGTGSIVIISGSGFTGTTAVNFNGASASFTVNSDIQISATAPAGVTTGLISVITPCGTANSSSNFTATVALDLKVFIEGFYTGSGQMTGVLSPAVCDTITVSLASSGSPYSIMYSVKGTINTTGNGTFNFPGSAFGNSFYLVINHRNTLETWSAAPMALPAALNNYDFTTSAAQAYGSNLINLGGVYAIVSGDVNQDGVINASDLLDLENSLQLLLLGYYPSDLTGDNLIESADFSLIENNIGLVKIRP